MCQDALDMEKSHGGERIEGKCRKDDDHDLRYRPGLEVIKFEFILKLKIKHKDWLLADMCPQTANRYAFFFSLRLYSSFITSKPGPPAELR